MKSPQLILADTHTLEPYTVQGFQFLARAAAFAEHWPAPVTLFLPGPAIANDRMLRAVNLTRWPETFAIRFGPPPLLRLGPVRIKTKSTYRAWIAKQLKEIATSDSALVYFRTLKLAAFLQPLLTELRYAYFFEPHELFFEAARNPKKFRVMEEKVYAGARHLYPISSGLAEGLQKEFGLKDSVTVAPLGHSGANLSLPPYNPAAEAHLLFTGSLLRWKGLETVLTAAHTLGVPFDVVGDAGGRSYYENYCRERGHTHVLFHGHVAPEDLSRYYLPGTICVLPLTRANIAMKYTSPLKLFEYLASGRPVVAGDVPSVREVVQEKIHAILLEPEDTDAWTRGLQALLSDRTAAAETALRGRELSRSCTWSERAKPLVDSLLSHCA